MRYRHVAGIVALSLGLGAAVAEAQYYSYMPPEEGPIFRLGLGPTFFQDGELTHFETPGFLPDGPVPSTVQYDTGVAFDAAFGWAFNKYTALDFETGFIGAEINNVPGYFSDNSWLYNVPFLVNFTLSFPIPHTILVPYVGVGMGGADVVFDTDNFQNVQTADFPTVNGVVGSENDVVFAGQAFAGLRFRISHNASFDLGYKFFATDRPTFTYPPDNFKVGFSGIRSHSVLFAFKFEF